MIRAFLTVSSGTLASRLLGFVRDAMIAALLGTGAVADAFLVAFQLVNVIRRLLTEGALNAALVPAWLRLRETEGDAAAGRFAGRVLGTIGAGLIALTVAIGLVMPWVIALVAPGFAGATLQLAVTDARLMLPYLAFAGPATVLLALSSAQGRFALTAFAPLLFNIALIAVMLALLASPHEAGAVATVLAATVGAAGFLQLAILMLRRRGDRLATPLRVILDSEMRGFLGRALPGMIASSAPQLLIVAGAVIASSSPSAVSWLYFANRLIELPLGIVGVAMGTVLIPELTRVVRGGDGLAIAHAESRALELAVGLALPATLGLIVLSEPIVRLLFEHGAFAATDTAATARALVFLALGLPAQVLVKALSPAFFAREDTSAPLIATLKAIVVAIIAAVLLGHFFGAAGIAGAIALGAWSQALALVRSGAATFGFSIERASRQRLPRIIAAAVLMGALLWLVGPFSGALGAGTHRFVQALGLLALIAAGLALYAALLAAFGVTGWREAVQAIRQPPVRDLRA
ncbi:MAG: murein biosynthesis integral membrane protein MurJ [Bradyrhizobium sp.]|uniref:murein biosynthesis integral membrane protein MurJ n=1 Tax=Bradyrhizobium sp. TaxID=376 RepID=UPI001D6A2F7B|nr:murein biosynthesis integral membrane protein MurJ [Bradyrhizobium sp.]MBV9566399.1 murein biosynthesis integral membrane protein MurJ [Bradyrhizobium sp.]